MHASTEKSCAEIEQLCRARNFGKAQELIARILENEPSDPGALFRIGELCTICGDFEKAAGDLLSRNNKQRTPTWFIASRNSCSS